MKNLGMIRYFDTCVISSPRRGDFFDHVFRRRRSSCSPTSGYLSVYSFSLQIFFCLARLPFNFHVLWSFPSFTFFPWRSQVLWQRMEMASGEHISSQSSNAVLSSVYGALTTIYLTEATLGFCLLGLSPCLGPLIQSQPTSECFSPTLILKRLQVCLL